MAAQLVASSCTSQLAQQLGCTDIMEFWDEILGAWGAILSTWLAFDQVRQRRSRRITLVAEWYPSGDEVQVQMVNIGMVPVTVRAVNIAYGSHIGVAKTIHTFCDQPFKLEPSAAKDFSVSRATIAEGRKIAGAQIDRRNFVWVHAELFGAGKKIVPIAIDAQAIGAVGLYSPAEQNIAADLLVGFARSEVENQPRNLSVRSR